MQILAIDTSARNTTVAILCDGELIGQLDAGDLASAKKIVTEAPAGKRQGVSALLAPLLQQLLAQCDTTGKEIDLFALTVGPGLFTGLRVGVVTAKAWAFANQTPVIGVNTLEVIAALAAAENPDHAGPIRVCVNAQRQQVFAGAYTASSSWSVESLADNEILDQADFVASLQAGDMVSGVGVTPMLTAIEDRVAADPSLVLAAQDVWNCDASSVGQVAFRHFQSGRRDDPLKLQPLYYRPSAAEEARLASS